MIWATYEPLSDNSVPYPANVQGQLTGSFPIPGSTTVTIDGIPLIPQEAPVIQGIPAEQPSMLITLARMTPEQQASKELVYKETSGARKPLTKEEADAILDWAQEYNYPGWRATPGDVSYPSNWGAEHNYPNEPHIHLDGIGRSDHLPVEPGVRLR